jgi:GNAT superfamily N-acetyltransferase
MKEAYISWSHDEDEGAYIIAHLYVPVEERGQGKARAMLRDAIAQMRDEGKANVIKLSADSKSEDPDDPIDDFALVEFYESEGFEVEYAGDVIVMAQEI